MRSLTAEEKAKLKHVVDEGVKILQELQDLREGLSDTVKSVAEEMDIKPALINKAIRAAHKKDLDAQRGVISDVEDLLTTIGRAG